MADKVQRIQYYHTVVPDKPGAGAKMLDVFKDAGASLQAVIGFPQGRQAQIDLVPADAVSFKAVAKSAKIKLVGPKSAFLIQGDDRAGALAEVVGKLAKANINITAVHAIAAQDHHYGAILWVKPKDVNKAAKLLSPMVEESPPLPLGK